MKARTLSTIAMAASLGVFALAPLFGSSTDDRPLAYRVRTLVDSTDTSVHIKRGAARGYVSRVMKDKIRQELSHDVWAFFSTPNGGGIGNLIITFANDKVVDIQLVNRPAYDAIATSLLLGTPAQNIASK